MAEAVVRPGPAMTLGRRRLITMDRNLLALLVLLLVLVGVLVSILMIVIHMHLTP
jgi:hypothetical protein